MASLRDIRRRISSVQNTRKITKAMEMVAAAKLRRNQARIEALRPYAGDMIEMMIDLATYSEDARQFALLQEREVKTVAVVAMTGDRGLAGAFNANVVRKALAIERDLREQGVETRVLAVGRKGIGTLKFRGCRLEKSWQGLSDRPQYTDAKSIAGELIEMYLSEQVDRVRLVYNHFTSPIEQTLMDDVILPVPKEAVTDGDEERPPVSYIYEPAPEDILEGLLPAVRRDRRVPGAPRVERQRAGRPHVGDAQRQRQRRGDDRRPHAGAQPRPPGGDHAGDPRSRRRRRGAGMNTRRGGRSPYQTREAELTR